MRTAESLKKLTAREREVLDLLGEGLEQKEICHRLGLGRQTVGDLCSRLHLKVGATNTFQLICYAVTGDPLAVAKKLSNKQAPALTIGPVAG